MSPRLHYSHLHCRLHNEIAKIAFVHVDSDPVGTVKVELQLQLQFCDPSHIITPREQVQILSARLPQRFLADWDITYSA